ncbi:ImmA/IrrE family metallo-endopeptidase [Pelagibius sp.]|uniref:ImmA/IrrE family metallo-endopeptidase n=1 Tax=Pelagibius sp. TaxID=1931238 RepID=UPI0026326138|nr:XRE family transcriptional regulator [Pelagibius sp.]
MDIFNHHMMALARDSRGWTQSDLATLMSVRQGTISKYESGVNQPPSEFISELSQVSKYRVGLFYETGRPYGMPPFHYRKRKKLNQKSLNKIIAEINIRRIHISKLLRSHDHIARAPIPEIDRDEYVAGSNRPFSIEGIARQAREYWMLPSGPIENVVNLIEEMCGIVVPCDFGTDLIDAVSQRIDGMPILFFVNMNAPADRIRHTLCHELGHMLLHTATILDDDVMEEEADNFAGAFLLPAKEVRPQLRTFDMRQLRNMKRYWKVSMGSIAVRADRLNLITPYQRKKFWMDMGRLGYRKREPDEPQKEVPEFLKAMIDFHLRVLDYSKEDLSKLLHLQVDEFDEWYGVHLLKNVAADPLKERGSFLRVIK